MIEVTCKRCGNTNFFYFTTGKMAFAVQGYLICVHCGTKKAIRRD